MFRSQVFFRRLVKRQNMGARGIPIVRDWRYTMVKVLRIEFQDSLGFYIGVVIDLSVGRVRHFNVSWQLNSDRNTLFGNERRSCQWVKASAKLPNLVFQLSLTNFQANDFLVLSHCRNASIRNSELDVYVIAVAKRRSMCSRLRPTNYL